MKIGIVGAGKTGSAIAFALMFTGSVDEIHMYDKDEDRLEGEVVDLNHASRLITGPRVFKCFNIVDVNKCDKVIICAGRGREPGEKMPSLYNGNRSIVKEITDRIGSGHLLVTNPVKTLAHEFGHTALGSMIDDIREQTDCKTGSYIIQKKGHTCWGIAAEIFRRII